MEISNERQEFFDSFQYTENGVMRYEKVFDRNFVSTGGRRTTEKIFENVSFLNDKSWVLDIGCGIGGSAQYMANRYGCHVNGIDLSGNMIRIAEKRLESDFKGDKSLVRFFHGDVLKNQPMNSGSGAGDVGGYDLIYSRDAIMHIEEKEKLFRIALSLLKPGGHLMVTDYCLGTEPNDDMREYLADRSYFLLTVSDYGKLLESIGFVNVEAIDKKEEFEGTLREELTRLNEMRKDFLKEHSQKDFDDLEIGWKQKLVRIAANQQTWGLFRACVPC